LGAWWRGKILAPQLPALDRRLHGAKRRRDPVFIDLDIEPMTRAELAEKILDIKREKGWTWKHVTDEIGGMSPILVVGALLGQMKLPKPLAETASRLFGLSESEKRMLNEVPTRGSPMPPTDPLIDRFYELIMVNGPALKALIEEEFGDGIMSAIDFDLDPRPPRPRQRRPRPAHHVRQVFAVQILRRRTGRAGTRVQGGVNGPAKFY
jgi:cyanate lyase